MGGYYGESYTVVEELSRNGYPPSSSNLPGSGVRAGSSAILILKILSGINHPKQQKKIKLR